MKKFMRAINITATVISIVSTLAVVMLIAIFSNSKEVKVEETVLVVEQTQLTRRETNNTVSFYAKNINRSAKHYIVIAFELYDIEKQNIYLTVDDEDRVYLIAVNEKQEASIVYN